MSKPQLVDSDFCRSAFKLGCEPAAIAAVAQQESLGQGFDAQDRPILLFERHIFHRLTGGIYDKTNPGISNATPGGYGLSASQYGRFSEAFALNPDAAMKSASWGKFQLLGRNYAICGFADVGSFVDAMKVSESNQLDAFCKFVLANSLDQYLTDKNWTSFALGYNGSTEKVHHYDDKIAARYAICKKHDYGCSTDSAATSPAPLAQTTDALVSPPADIQADQPGTPPISNDIDNGPIAGNSSGIPTGSNSLADTPVASGGLLATASSYGDKLSVWQATCAKLNPANYLPSMPTGLGTKLLTIWGMIASVGLYVWHFLYTHPEVVIPATVIFIAVIAMWVDSRHRNNAKGAVPPQMINTAVAAAVASPAAPPTIQVTQTNEAS